MFTFTTFLYEVLNILDFIKFLNKSTLLLVFKHINYLPEFYHNYYNTRRIKYINLVAPIYEKEFGNKNCLNRAILFCRNLITRINKYINVNLFKLFIMKKNELL